MPSTATKETNLILLENEGFVRVRITYRNDTLGNHAELIDLTTFQTSNLTGYTFKVQSFKAVNNWK